MQLPKCFFPWEEKHKISLGGNIIKNHDYFPTIYNQ